MENYNNISRNNFQEKIKKSNDTLTDYFFNRRLSIQITKMLINTNITPNQVTFLSTALDLLAAFLFLFGEYHLNILGALLLNCGIIVDCVDGELARSKDMCTTFGYWFDHYSDWIGHTFVFIAIFMGQYGLLLEQNILPVGIMAVINIIIINVLIFIKYKYPALNKPAIAIGNSKRIGFSELIIFIAMCAIIDQMIFVLWLGATVLTLIWIKSLWGIIKILKERNTLKNP